MVRKQWLWLVVASVVVSASVADAGLFGWLRPRARCASNVCAMSVQVTETAVQKDDAVQKDAVVPEAVQKTPEAVQKTDEAVQKEDAVQKAEAAPVMVMGPLQALCLRKARWQASRGRVGHPGWGMLGARCEGAGSGATPAQAYSNCCFWGQRRVAAKACVQGRGGRWFATVLYW